MNNSPLRKNVIIFIIMTSALLACVGLVARLAFAVENAGMITDLKGNVLVNKAKAQLLQKLHPNDEITGHKGSVFTVTFFADGHTESVTGVFTVKITKESLIAIKGDANISKTAILKKKGSAKINDTEIAKGGAVLVRGYKPIYPASGESIDTTTPEFRWEGEAQLIKKYYVVFQEEGDSDNYSYIEIKDQEEAQFPADLKPLVRGKKYRWQLAADTHPSMEKGDDDPSPVFRINTIEEEKALKKQEEEYKKLIEQNPGDNFPHTLLIHMYLERHAYSYALKEADTLASSNPNTPYVYRLYALIYKYMGSNKKSEEMENKAVKLEEKQK